MLFLKRTCTNDLLYFEFLILICFQKNQVQVGGLVPVIKKIANRMTPILRKKQYGINSCYCKCCTYYISVLFETLGYVHYILTNFKTNKISTFINQNIFQFVGHTQEMEKEELKETLAIYKKN